MATYNNLLNEYKDKLDDLTPEDVKSLLESLVRKEIEAYKVYDFDKMKLCTKEINDAMDLLDNRFNNIRLFVSRRRCYYESSLHMFRIRRGILRDAFHNLEAYIHLYGQLESSFFHLHDLLSIYYFNYGNSHVDNVIGKLSCCEEVSDEVVDVIVENVYDDIHNDIGINYFLMGNLDDSIGVVRDSILETMEMIEEKHYSPNDSQKELDDSISEIRNHIHELIEDDYYQYQRENGIVEVELGWVDVFKIEHELNKAYGMLKSSIEELFDGNNGFKDFVELFHENVSRDKHPREEVDSWHPKYNIMETRFIPPEIRKDDKIWEKYYNWKERR